MLTGIVKTAGKTSARAARSRHARSSEVIDITGASIFASRRNDSISMRFKSILGKATRPEASRSRPKRRNLAAGRRSDASSLAKVHSLRTISSLRLSTAIASKFCLPSLTSTGRPERISDIRRSTAIWSASSGKRVSIGRSFMKKAPRGNTYKNDGGDLHAQTVSDKHVLNKGCRAIFQAPNTFCPISGLPWQSSFQFCVVQPWCFVWIASLCSQ